MSTLRSSPRRAALAVALAVGVTTSMILGLAAADARTLRWARSMDSSTLDPHAANTGPNHALLHHVYEPLVMNDRTGKVVPVLALSWAVLPNDPTVWEFKLRPGVKFQNGNAFTADDVIFSIRRAQQAASDMKTLVGSIVEIEKVDDLTVRFKTNGPNALLPENLTNLFMMDQEWSEANNAANVQDLRATVENGATRAAMGTGPYILIAREPQVRTVMRRFEEYWGRTSSPMEVSELIYLPIRENATRIAALLSNEVDFVQDVPVQDIARLQATQNIRVSSGPENRTIFLGMDQGSPELRTSDVKGKNPFADRRVRQAMNLIVNREAIGRVVMRGQARPTGLIFTPFINGFSAELDRLPSLDANRARALLTEAGYPNGFTVTMHCTNDRYVNDEGICQAVVGMFAQIGIRVTLVSQQASVHFPMIRRREIDMYLLGWGVPTYDSEYNFTLLYHTNDGTNGGWNGTRYSNPQLDTLIRGLNAETNTQTRNATIARIWQQLKDDTVYIPLHVQFINYAMRSEIEIPIFPDNQPKMKDVSFRRS